MSKPGLTDRAFLCLFAAYFEMIANFNPEAGCINLLQKLFR